MVVKTCKSVNGKIKHLDQGKKTGCGKPITHGNWLFGEIDSLFIIESPEWCSKCVQRVRKIDRRDARQFLYTCPECEYVSVFLQVVPRFHCASCQVVFEVAYFPDHSIAAMKRSTIQMRET